MPSSTPIGVVTAESVTQLRDVAGKVLIAGSHGGIIAGYYGASAGVRALILNDAGIGKGAAGIAALPYLAAIGMAAAAVSHLSARIGDGAATVDCMSARIGDARSMWESGRISHVNGSACRAGVRVGQRVREFARRVAAA